VTNPSLRMGASSAATSHHCPTAPTTRIPMDSKSYHQPFKITARASKSTTLPPDDHGSGPRSRISPRSIAQRVERYRFISTGGMHSPAPLRREGGKNKWFLASGFTLVALTETPRRRGIMPPTGADVVGDQVFPRPYAAMMCCIPNPNSRSQDSTAAAPTAAVAR